MGAAIPHKIGRYRVIGEVARGGMGVILRAYDPGLDREVAVKILSSDRTADSEAGLRLAEEARILSRLHHPGVMPVYEAGALPDGRPYFAMPFVEGQTLAARLGDPLAHDVSRFLVDHPSREQVFPLEQIADAFETIRSGSGLKMVIVP
jgi:serine/threonine-protein kinase